MRSIALLLLGLLALSAAAYVDDEYPSAQYEEEDQEQPEYVEDVEEENDDESDEESDESEDEENSDENDDEETESDVQYAKYKDESPQLVKLYRHLKGKYNKLSNEISGQVRGILRRKYAWLKLLYARRRWYVIHRRYRQLANKFKGLPEKRFLVRAYKNYVKSEEFNLGERRKQYKYTTQQASKYMKNLKHWVQAKKDKIHALRLKMREFLQNHKDSLTPQQREDIRVNMRHKLREEHRKLDAVTKYWDNKIEADDLPIPAPANKNAIEPGYSPAGKPLSILKPHPMVPFVRRQDANGVLITKKPNKWISALNKVDKRPKKNLSAYIKKAEQTVVKKPVIKTKGWFKILDERAAGRKFKRQTRRLRRDKKRLNRIAKSRKARAARVTRGKKRSWRAVRKARKARLDKKDLRKFKKMIRGAFRAAWGTAPSQ